MINEKRLHLLSEAPVLPTIIKMSLPVVMGMMVQVLYNLVDVFFIGLLNDPKQLAAVNLSTPVIMILMAIASIIGNGGASYASRSIGENKMERANQTVTTGLVICVGLALLSTCLGLLFADPLVRALGADSSTFAHTKSYMVILMSGTVFVMLNFSMSQLLRSEGVMIPAMLGMFLSTVSNIILDPIFIFGLDMGIAGAAIATVLGNLIGMIYYLVLYYNGTAALKIKKKYFTTNPLIWKEIFLIGTPSALNQFLVSCALILSNNVAATYGTDLVAGMGIASKIMTLGTFLFIGISAGCQPLIGFNYGAQNFKRMQSVLKNSMLLASSLGILLALFFGIGAPWLIGLFTNINSVSENGIFALRILLLSLPVLGSQMLSSSAIQSMGKALPAFLLSISRQGIFFVPLLFSLNYFFGKKGFLLAQPVSDIITLLIALTVLTVILRKEIACAPKNSNA